MCECVSWSQDLVTQSSFIDWHIFKILLCFFCDIMKWKYFAVKCQLKGYYMYEVCARRKLKRWSYFFLIYCSSQTWGINVERLQRMKIPDPLLNPCCFAYNYWNFKLVFTSIMLSPPCLDLLQLHFQLLTLWQWILVIFELCLREGFKKKQELLM